MIIQFNNVIKTVGLFNFFVNSYFLRIGLNFLTPFFQGVFFLFLVVI